MMKDKKFPRRDNIFSLKRQLTGFKYVMFAEGN